MTVREKWIARWSIIFMFNQPDSCLKIVKLFERSSDIKEDGT